MSSWQAKKWIVATVAAHSLILGVVFLARPLWALRFVGWEYTGSSFFPAQAGLFLLILGGAYLAGVWYEPFAWFLVASKAAAFVFLIGEYFAANAPPVILPIAVVDGLMGAAMATALIYQSSPE